MRSIKRKPYGKRSKKTYRKRNKKHMNNTRKRRGGGMRRLISSTQGELMPDIPGINRGNQYTVSSRGIPSGLSNPPALSGGVINGNNRTYSMRGGDPRNSLIPISVLTPSREVWAGVKNSYNSFFGKLPTVDPRPWVQTL